jgi:hypothetical protein
MGFRFRKRISLGKILHFNLSKSGVSTSIGRPGATVNLGKRPKLTVGIPGSGLSYQASLPKRKRTKPTQASALPSDPLALKGRRLLEIIDQLKVLPPLDGEHDPLPGLKQRLEVLGEGIELLRDIQAIRPGEPIERALKSFEALLEWNRWTQINYTDHTEETADAEKNADADFQANKLTDQHSGKRSGDISERRGRTNTKRSRLALDSAAGEAWFSVSFYWYWLDWFPIQEIGARLRTRPCLRSPQKSRERSCARQSQWGYPITTKPEAQRFRASRLSNCANAAGRSDSTRR